MSDLNDSAEIDVEKAGNVQAGTVTVSRSSVDTITADRATIEQSSVKNLKADSAQFDRSSVFKMQAENAVISQSAATFVRADEVRLVKSNALFVRSGETTVEGDLKTIVHLGNATGNVHMMFDKQGALRFGAGLGASLVGLSVLVRRLFR